MLCTAEVLTLDPPFLSKTERYATAGILKCQARCILMDGILSYSIPLYGIQRFLKYHFKLDKGYPTHHGDTTGS